MSIEFRGGRISFSGALFLTFLVLKLVGVIDWSWWWVTAPLWISLAIFAALVLIVCTAIVVGDERKRRRRRRR